MKVVYIVGNSRQLQLLSQTERTFLDTQEDVYTLNHFLSHYREAGFRPSHWVYGDNHEEACVQGFREELFALADSPALQWKLRWIRHGAEQCSAEAEAVVRAAMKSITPSLSPVCRSYRRGFWKDRDQVVSDDANHPILHLGSTITDLVHLAWLKNKHLMPSLEIRVLGCEFGNTPGHFYREPSVTGICNPDAFLTFTELFWEGFHKLREHGVPIVNCNQDTGIISDLVASFPKKRIMEA